MRTILALFLCLLAVPALADTRKYPDLAYGPDKLQKLDVYQPDICKNANCPVVMWVHGGGWRMGSKDYRGSPNLAAAWCPRGAVLVGIDYRLSPDVMHPAHVQDVAAAINWVKQNISHYGGNPSRIFLLGHSAGAHLVALVATDPQYLAAYNLPLTALAGVFPIDSASYDLNSSLKQPWVGKMVKQAFGDNPQQLSAASPLDQVQGHSAAHYPPFILAAAKQRPGAVLQMNQMARALQTSGGQVETVVMDYPGQRQLQAHGDIAKDLSNPQAVMTQMLMRAVGVQP